MKVAGFTIIRNAITYDYPIVESIKSILPVCDIFVVAIGNSTDDTRALIEKIDPEKIVIIDTIWDDSLRIGGAVLAKETDKALQGIPVDYDWAFYIQGDEVVHEQYLPTIRQAMESNLKNTAIEGLLFKYKHFYGSYDYVGDSRKWYRREIRIIRNNKDIKSYKDAQGFRWANDRKLSVTLIDAYVYHYGWVKHPDFQEEKRKNFNKLWHDDNWIEENILNAEFDYSQIDSLEKFEGTHPSVMQKRIDNMNWKFSFDPTVKKFSIKDRFLYWIEKQFGWRIGEYRNYVFVKK